MAVIVTSINLLDIFFLLRFKFSFAIHIATAKLSSLIHVLKRYFMIKAFIIFLFMSETAGKY